MKPDHARIILTTTIPAEMWDQTLIPNGHAITKDQVTELARQGVTGFMLNEMANDEPALVQKGTTGPKSTFSEYSINPREILKAAVGYGQSKGRTQAV